MIDLLDYIMAPDSTKASFHQESADGTKYNATLWQPGWMFNIKSAQGFPCDSFHYDDQFIYQNTTEGPQGWTNPTSYKAFAAKTWPNGHGGIAWMPRFIDPAQGASDPLFSDSTYVTLQGGKPVGVPQNLGGDVATIVRGPAIMDVGALKQVSVITQSYFWNNGVKQEVNTYAYDPVKKQGLGLVKWQGLVLQNGVYVQDIDSKGQPLLSLMDTQKPGGTPALVFPNPLP